MISFVAISLSKVYSELLHTDSRGIASPFNDTSIHVLSCDGYQGQLLKACVHVRVDCFDGATLVQGLFFHILLQKGN